MPWTAIACLAATAVHASRSMALADHAAIKKGSQVDHVGTATAHSGAGGQGKTEAGAKLWNRVDGKPTGMEVQDTFCDREPETGAARGLTLVFLHLVEAVEDVLQLLWGDAATRVGDLNGYSAACLVEDDLHLALLGSVT